MFYSEQKWLEEKKQVLKATSDHVEQVRQEKEKLSEHKWVQVRKTDTKRAQVGGVFMKDGSKKYEI